MKEAIYPFTVFGEGTVDTSNENTTSEGSADNGSSNNNSTDSGSTSTQPENTVTSLKYLIIYNDLSILNIDYITAAALLKMYFIKNINASADNIIVKGSSEIDFNKYFVSETANTYTNVSICGCTFTSSELSLLYDKFGDSLFIYESSNLSLFDLTNVSSILGVRTNERSTSLCVYKYLFDQYDVNFDNGSLTTMPYILQVINGYSLNDYDTDDNRYPFTFKTCNEICYSILNKITKEGKLDFDIYYTVFNTLYTKTSLDAIKNTSIDSSSISTIATSLFNTADTLLYNTLKNYSTIINVAAPRVTTYLSARKTILLHSNNLNELLYSVNSTTNTAIKNLLKNYFNLGIVTKNNSGWTLYIQKLNTNEQINNEISQIFYPTSGTGETYVPQTSSQINESINNQNDNYIKLVATSINSDARFISLYNKWISLYNQQKCMEETTDNGKYLSKIYPYRYAIACENTSNAYTTLSTYLNSYLASITEWNVGAYAKSYYKGVGSTNFAKITLTTKQYITLIKQSVL